MKENANKILDSQGRPINSRRTNRLKEFFKENVWNILGTGIASCITIVSLLNMLISKSYANSCAEYYGVHKKYFSGTEIFEDKVIFVFCAILLFAYPFFFDYVNRKMKSKAYLIITFLLSIIILFMQNILYTVNLIERIPYEEMRIFIDNYITIIIFLIADVIIAYFLIIRNYFWYEKPYKRIEKILLSLAMIIYAIDTAAGVSIALSYQIGDKKSYEVIENNRVIVSTYDGKFVVMNCEIQEEWLLIEKGTYSLEEMAGLKITYHEYDEVICK